ncbi:MAG: zinc ribbon domain-containing protein [Gammaproteobacteria bacterium]|nr:zinc ribbon domain-containing protein [Gammaproteobacteria bacterium]
MPIYEYQCTECGYQTEVLQKISDEPLKDCPDCGKPTMKKMVTAAAFRLKGGGWYETDFKAGDKKKNVHAADDTPKSDSKAKDKPASGGDKKASGSGTSSAKKSSASKN